MSLLKKLDVIIQGTTLAAGSLQSQGLHNAARSSLDKVSTLRMVREELCHLARLEATLRGALEELGTSTDPEG